MRRLSLVKFRLGRSAFPGQGKTTAEAYKGDLNVEKRTTHSGLPDSYVSGLCLGRYDILGADPAN